jgi:hypothetical protein
MSNRPFRAHRRASRPRSLTAARVVLVLSIVGFASTPVGAGAQEAIDGRFELRPFVGAYVPTGEQRELLRRDVLVGAQASYRFIPQFAVTGTLAWSPTQAHGAPGDPTVDLYQYDVGAEGRARVWQRGTNWSFTPFAGLGVGGRTYRDRDGGIDVQSVFTGYGALGGALGFGRLGVRVEGRNYVSRAATRLGRGGGPDARNDVTLGAGLTIRF